MKNLTRFQNLAAINAQLQSAISISDVTRIARAAKHAEVTIERLPCGYRITEGK